MTEAGRAKILIVDDRRENLLVLRRILSELDADVVEARNGNDALAATLYHDFALAILDIVMPGMDGYELAALLRGDPRTRRLPIIFMTAAYGEAEQVYKGYEAGAVDYLVKPYDPRVLLSKVSVFLDLHRKNVALAEQLAERERAEQELERHREHLEDLVAERTAELHARSQELRAAAQQWQTTFEAMRDGVALLDQALVIRRCNSALAELAGMAREQLVGQPCWRAIRDRSEAPAECPAMRARESLQRESWQTIAGERWVDITADPILDEEGRLTGVVQVFSDVTERKRAEQSLLRRTEALQQMNAELEEFAYVASHDLKAPLRAVANLAFVIDEDTAGALDEENRGRLQMLRERVKGMDALIEGLLRYGRLGRSERHLEPVDLAGLLEEVAGGVELPPGFRVEWQPDTLPTLYGDRLELRQIFQNLVTNAAAHHDRAAEGHLWVAARDAGAAWELEVADDGPGIAEHMRPRAFRMFSTGGKPGHTGIGLAVVRKLVLANGGQIALCQRSPRGALFRIRWPKPETAARARPGAPVPASGRPAR